MHNPVFSDIDVMVYGTDESFRVKNVMSDTEASQDSRIERFKGEKLKQWCARKSQNHPISIAEAKLLHQRKWNIGMFGKTPFSVHPAKTEKELTEKYGDKKYQARGMVTIQATVTESVDSVFLPAVYKVGEVEIDGEISAEIEEVVSYESLYDSLADPSEVIQAHGKLEHVTDSRTDKEYDRVLVGSIEGRGKEYIKPLN
jgi:predicted nucleotidyltransferase